MYGTSADMDHTLLRFGNRSIDSRVEPFGWNALHFAVRRGVPKLVEVRNLLELYSVTVRVPTARAGSAQQRREPQPNHYEWVDASFARLQIQRC